MIGLRRAFGLLLLLLAPGLALAADPTSYDLAGPKLRVTVTRGTATLPIAEVPSLDAGDQLSIKADLPASQSVRYLLVAAFLQGATNPPPPKWFFSAPTWTAKGREGLKLAVPTGAQQVLLFLAPQANGDLKAVMAAVHGRPGAFVRASQDLNQASLDRSRLEAYLTAIHRSDASDQDHLGDVSPLLARSLAIKLNADCLKKTPELQAACLTDGQGALVLSDPQRASFVQTLTTGQSADLINQIGATRAADSGFYSPYIGAVMDIARIVDSSFHTAQYQYAPAITTADGEVLSLVLNTPPSFHAPMSVLMAALPPVAPPQPPVLRLVDPKAAYCITRPSLVVPVDGAPEAFATAYAHDMVLHVERPGGAAVDIPVKADAEHGGFVADTSKADAATLGDVRDATLRGVWGFEPFEGPHVRVQAAGPGHWSLAAEDQQSLVVGRDDVVHLTSPRAVCVQSVALRQPGADPQPVTSTLAKPDEVALTLPLRDAQPGIATLLIKQFGAAATEETPLQTFTQAGRLDGFVYHAGDAAAALKGARLDEVAGLTFRGVAFQAGGLVSANGGDELTLTPADPAALAALKVGDGGAVKVTFRNGHVASLHGAVQPARPSAALISKTINPPAAGGVRLIQLTDTDELEAGGSLTFSLRAAAPPAFAHDLKVEVAGADGTVLTTLTLAKGLVLEDPTVAIATLDTAQAFSPSTFGPLKFRVVEGAAGPGDWQTLATLVRLPTLREFKCAPAAAHGRRCQLLGANLFLIDALSADRAFDRAVDVPEGFTGAAVAVPQPAGRRLFVKLHDSPTVVNEIELPAEK
jgi:hypothetical protein